jgi:hypothetical protein
MYVQYVLLGVLHNTKIGDRRSADGVPSRYYTTQYNMVYISPFDSSLTPGAFYTYFYNHVRRLRLENLL